MRKRLGTAAAIAAVGIGGAVGVAVVAPSFASAAGGASPSPSPTATSPSARPSAPTRPTTADRTAALTKALAGLVADGTITQQQADKVASTLATAGPGVLGGHGPGRFGGLGGPGGFGRFGAGADGLAAAAKALGVTEDSLRTSLRDGKSLADVAADKKVPVTTVVAAIVAAEKKAIAAAVTAKDLTQAQADRLLTDLTKRVTDRVNATRPDHAGFGLRGGRPA